MSILELVIRKVAPCLLRLIGHRNPRPELALNWFRADAAIATHEILKNGGLHQYRMQRSRTCTLFVERKTNGTPFVKDHDRSSLYLL